MALDKLNMEFKNKGETGAIPINSTNLNKITKKIDEIIDKLYPIGTYYMTSDDNFNPNITWGGTWVKEEDGTVLSSKSTEEGSLLNADTGSVVGEDKHTMTVDELASHDHEYNGWSYQINAGTAGVYALCKPYNVNNNFSESGNKTGTKTTGSATPFNIIQKTKIVNVWHRTA